MSLYQLPRQGWYKRFFAWMLARNADVYERHVAARKQKVFATLEGAVVEIGPGTGSNFRYYPPDIHWIGIEPNLYMRPYLERQAAKYGIAVDFRAGRAERLELPDGSADAVVSTLVMCSVRDQGVALSEVLRVLKPGGRLVFVEHIAAPRGTRLRLLQRLVLPGWRLLGDGCCPDRETWAVIERAGFSDVKYERFRVPFPVVSPHIIGVATK